VVVDDIAEEVGGKQSFTVTDNIGKRSVIPLKFNGDIMTVVCCSCIPTDEEIMALKINWITPPMEEVTPQLIRRAKRAVEEYQLKVPDDGDEIPDEEIAVHDNTDPKAGKGERTVGEWKQLLAFPSDEVVERTLLSTTQLQVEPVESERQDIPR